MKSPLTLLQIFEVLKQEIGMGYECWTSSARAKYGLETFEGDEADFADFTITDPAMSAKCAEWLLNKIGVAAAADWLDTHKNFHIEVKTTNGPLNEKFEMSNNQARLVRCLMPPSRSTGDRLTDNFNSRSSGTSALVTRYSSSESTISDQRRASKPSLTPFSSSRRTC